MIALSEFLEDFGEQSLSASVDAAQPPSADIEGLRLEAFENGYKAGWDDAVKAQSEDRTRISSNFGQHLQDLSFTYHEAHGQIMNAMTPLLNEMVKSVLPKIARDTLGDHIREQLYEAAQVSGTLDVVIAVAPENMEAVAPIVNEDFGFPVTLVEDDSLSDEQADIRFGDSEQQIDLGGLLASVSDAVAGFTHENQRKIANG